MEILEDKFLKLVYFTALLPLIYWHSLLLTILNENWAILISITFPYTTLFLALIPLVQLSIYKKKKEFNKFFKFYLISFCIELTIILIILSAPFFGVEMSTRNGSIIEFLTIYLFKIILLISGFLFYISSYEDIKKYYNKPLFYLYYLFMFLAIPGAYLILKLIFSRFIN